jgi:uncharacterized protein HemY
MNENAVVETTEATPAEAPVNVYYTPQPTVGQQIASTAVATIVPLAATVVTIAVVGVAVNVGQKVQTWNANRKAKKASKKNVVVVEETTPTE